MEYREIDQAMRNRSLAADPAFSDLHFLIESIPCFDGCPLGLYYPGTGIIIMETCPRSMPRTLERRISVVECCSTLVIVLVAYPTLRRCLKRGRKV